LNYFVDQWKSNDITRSVGGSRPPAGDCFADIFASPSNVSSWPKAPVDAPGLNGRLRGVPAVGSAKRDANDA
jgi:hypothetical protein